MNDLWEFTQMLTRALVKFDKQITGPTTIIEYPLAPQGHMLEELTGVATFDLHGRLMGLSYK